MWHSSRGRQPDLANLFRQWFRRITGNSPHDRMTAHMGMFEVKDQVYGFMGISPAAGSDPRSEPVSMTRWHAPPDQAHIRSPLIAAAPISRVRRVGAQEAGTILTVGC